MVVPIRKVIRNKRMLCLLESQFPKRTEFGVEFFESNSSGIFETERYKVYTRHDGNEWYKDRFIIVRTRRRGIIREYCLEGSVYFGQ